MNYYRLSTETISALEPFAQSINRSFERFEEATKRETATASNCAQAHDLIKLMIHEKSSLST